MVAEGEGDDEGFEGAGLNLAGESLLDLFDGRVFGVDGGVVEAVFCGAQADGGVFEVEVDHLEVRFAGAGEILGDALDPELVFAEAHGGDVGEAVVFVDEVGVGERGVEAAGEYVEDSHGVAGGEPAGDGERKGEGCVVAVRGKDKDVQGGTPVASLIVSG